MSDHANGSPGLPIFDRRFFDGRERFTQIGRGALGGKASGLVFIREAITRAIDPAAYPGLAVDVPTMAVVTTEFFDDFVRQNRLHELPVDELPDDRIAHAFLHADLPTELVGDLWALTRKVHSPLAIRSSSLLEDALGRPFAGVYATKMIPNNQFDPDARFRRLVEAIKFVYASTYFREARDYIRATDRAPSEEKMAVIIQEVVGQRRGERFYPELSGVARSYNFYPSGPARPEEGVVNLALGLGKTIVDGGLSWTYSPAHPGRSAPFGSVSTMLEETQTEFWAVNMGKAPAYDPVSEVEYLVRADLAAAEADEALRFLASTYDADGDRLVVGVGRPGPRVLNFAPLLQIEELPFNDVMRELLRTAEQALGAKIEIEFAMTFDTPRDGPKTGRLGFLQVRPMVVSDELVEVTAGELADSRALVASESVMGNGVRDDLQDVVYVRPEKFESRHTRAIAAQVEQVNQRLTELGRRYVLIGFGRWGSADPWLGIPVNWAQISGARAIVETTAERMNVEASQGSHFFHNLSSFRVSYFTGHHEGPRPVDWRWLDARPAEMETEFMRWVRLAAPLVVRVDGRTGRGVILREQA